MAAGGECDVVGAGSDVLQGEVPTLIMGAIAVELGEARANLVGDHPANGVGGLNGFNGVRQGTGFNGSGFNGFNAIHPGHHP